MHAPAAHSHTFSSILPAEALRTTLRKIGTILCLDIGSGTQDVLLACPHLEIENWPRFVMPTPARMIAQRIEELTAMQKPIWLYGQNMGGGFVRAVKLHMSAGLAVSCSPFAAAAIHDDMTQVQDMGIDICPKAPIGAVPVHLADFDAPFWNSQLRLWGLPQPSMVLAAAQDHGIHPDGNRKGRMASWRRLLEKSPQPEHWLYTDAVIDAAPELTRLVTLQALTGGCVADTGTAAILGALCAPEVVARSQREGVTIVNVGNSHTVAVLYFQGKVCGIFEHHTGQRSLEDFLHDLQEFRRGWLPDEMVRETGGHGTAFGHIPEEASGFIPTFILGPRRHMLHGHGQFIAPYGDMMLAGCFGLLHAFALNFTEK